MNVNKDKLNEALDLLINEEKDLATVLEKGGLIKQITKRLVERALDAEMKDHLGYAKHDRSRSNNARNGSYSKGLLTTNGKVAIEVPRDRDGDFEPQIVKKRQTRINGLDQKVISLYAKGMSVSDIKKQLAELYDVDISESFISTVTSEVMEDVKTWQCRPLESVYPIVFFDCIVIKVRQDNMIRNKSVYVALGIDVNGKKDILGLWISENEGAKFWLSNFTDLKNRGVKDILIACTDNLKGMNEAIAAAYPKCEHQLCIVHQIRNSLKYVSYKDRKEVCSDLKAIYTASKEESALQALEDFNGKWSKKYPQIYKSWEKNWANLAVFLQYPQEIRKVIYTTNSIESLNSQFRKVIKNKKIFPNDDSVFKILYLTIDYITAKWSMPIRNWNEAMAHFLIKFEGRL